MAHLSAEMKHCVELCLHCYATCTATAMSHCLEAGGEHVEPHHFRLMMACAEICRTCAHFMLIGSDHYTHICRQCAEICGLCAADCERIGGMEECVEACRKSTASCRKMAA